MGFSRVTKLMECLSMCVEFMGMMQAAEQLIQQWLTVNEKSRNLVPAQSHEARHLGHMYMYMLVYLR